MMLLGKKLRRHRGWIAVAIVLVIGGVALYVARSANTPTAETTYTTEAAAKGTLSVTVDGTGNLAVRDEVDAYPSTGGTVSKVLVGAGDTVDKGDVLYRLSAADVEKAITNAYAAKLSAATSVQKANLDLYKVKAALTKLQDDSDNASSTVISSDITAAKKEVSLAQAGVSAAARALTSAASDYNDAVDSREDLSIEAPCDGVVWSVDIAKGDAVSEEGGSGSDAASATNAASTAPVTIARNGQLGVELSINEVDVTSLDEGQDAEIEFDAVTDLTVTGKVDEIAREGTVESGVVTYNVWLTLDATDKQLKTGMSATVTIVTQVERNALLVSNSAVKTATDGTSSYVQVMDNGATAPRDVIVTTGLAGSTQTVIESGITEGTLVVTKTTDASSSSSSSGDSGSNSSGRGGFMLQGGPPAGGGPGGL